MVKIKVLIVDDQALIRDGLKSVLVLEKELEVVGTARGALEAYEMISYSMPQVVLMDIRMPGIDGVHAVTLIKKSYPEIKVLMLTTFNDEEYIVNALAEGAKGYILKDIEIPQLVEAIKDAYLGKMIVPPEVAQKLQGVFQKLSAVKKTENEKQLQLPEREKEIAVMLVQGFTNRQIAKALFITEGTLRNYLSNIYRRLDVNDRTNAVLYLKEHGF
ncbi:MAG: response regulator transcription factor [Bacillota bacterium]|nr:response regulator transcription factor [Bacillota bacterium]